MIVNIKGNKINKNNKPKLNVDSNIYIPYQRESPVLDHQNKDCGFGKESIFFSYMHTLDNTVG